MNINKITIRNNQQEEIEDLTTAFPYVLHKADLSRMNIPWHWHEELEFCYIANGMVEVSTIDRKYIFREHEGFFINSKTLCSMKPCGEKGPVMLDSHLFHAVFLSGHYKSVFETEYISPVLENKNIGILPFVPKDPVDMEILKALRAAANIKRESGSQFRVRNIFSDIWILLIKKIEQMPKEDMSSSIKNQGRMQSMMSFIHQYYNEHITLDDIAAAAAVSKRECIRCFKNTISRSPIEYLTEYRLDAARKLLRNSEYSITEISFHTGFSSNAYFGKVFREHYGVTPIAYRKAQM